jgi:hypothetical protein
MTNRIKLLISVLVGVIALGLWSLLEHPPRVLAQYMGTFSQQLDTETVSLTWGNTPSTQSLKNLGQAGHTLLIPPQTGGGAGCSIVLQGSGEKTNWVTLAVLPHPAITNTTAALSAFGSYPYYRVVANPNSKTCTAGAITAYYVGYQFPPSAVLATETFLDNVASLSSLFPTGTDPNPYQVLGGQCYNPSSVTGSISYLDLWDSATTPTLGTGYFYEIEIGAATAHDFDMHSFTGNYILWAAAVTTQGGTTPVSSAFECDFQVNRRGPFTTYSSH